MSCSVNDKGQFQARPNIDDFFISPEGEPVAVAAIWGGGVVFAGGRACSARDLVEHYRPLKGFMQPLCVICGARHEPEYPHLFTDELNKHIQGIYGRDAQQSDTFEHCTGLIRAAMEAAHQ